MRYLPMKWALVSSRHIIIILGRRTIHLLNNIRSHLVTIILMTLFALVSTSKLRSALHFYTLQKVSLLGIIIRSLISDLFSLFLDCSNQTGFSGMDRLMSEESLASDSSNGLVMSCTCCSYLYSGTEYRNL